MSPVSSRLNCRPMMLICVLLVDSSCTMYAIRIVRCAEVEVDISCQLDSNVLTNFKELICGRKNLVAFLKTKCYTSPLFHAASSPVATPSSQPTATHALNMVALSAFSNRSDSAANFQMHRWRLDLSHYRLEKAE
jgi:hypothetical protein